MNACDGFMFSISSNNIPGNINSPIDLTIKFGSTQAPSALLQEIMKDSILTKHLVMTYHGDFGMDIGLHFNLGSENAGKYADLYKYHPTDKKMEYIGSFLIQEKGQAMFTIAEGADYLVIVK